MATLGPASSDRAMISKLFAAGVDVFRINMSHTSHDKMREFVTTIRAVESDSAGRSEFWSICRGRSCGSARSTAARR